jgi:hypothetical protein
MTQVVVLDYQEPIQRLLAWFISDAEVSCERVETIAGAIDALGDDARLLVVNSRADAAAIANAVAAVRRARDGGLRILVLHDGRHREHEQPVEADLCVHDVHDMPGLVEAIVAAANDEVPDWSHWATREAARYG